MVHNGIEYGDMQVIGEAYHLLKAGLDLSADELSAVFADWNKSELNSFLVEITAQIFSKKDEDGQPLIAKYSIQEARKARASGLPSRRSTSECR